MGSTVFGKVDLNTAYHQIDLTESCHYITTFSTHIGLKRYTRLNYGMNSVSDIFGNIIRQLVSDIPGVKNITDDIIIFGEDTDAHDLALRSHLHASRKNG